ncbi:CRISPR-associated helicase/endonuclease Cas3 [Salipaludibacillus aurantiacus]|uniref:CRISPR-associated endonuclease/helicase Cas3 n=1 Tax=Salipaludibacillus aurantiacus TaxID=1601833 RepID=A0A1H9W853_9BACI|nr:CRISPR-associated helicase/endonuclease Cas3 [Salipaludibacillus aurantiacus]SES30025.1 CRISPR-associated endonuclease/helicase Cas3 [Salipaludibacillus aurantiacus]
MEFIAHIRENDGSIQTVEDHLLETKALAEKFGKSSGMGHICGLSALLHDAGKLTEEFRDYILKAVNDPEHAPKRGSVDHSTAGGKILFNSYHSTQSDPFYTVLSEVVGNAIISHHSYLHDFLTPDLDSPYLRRVKEKELLQFKQTKDYFYRKVMDENTFDHYVTAAKDELKILLKNYAPEDYPRHLHFITKFVFSSLIDADRTNTRLFEENQEYEPINSAELMDNYYDKLMMKIKAFKEHPDAGNRINKLRASMSDQCEDCAEKPSDIYTLSIPTGGGKTLASLRYALKHAKKYGKKRIFYIVPFTTIIEQNAQEVRKILQDDEHILEHHSNVIEEDYEENERFDGMISPEEKLRLAKDNWDSPIIFTTMVQFLNVFYEKKSRSVRRLHRLSDAVIIFDEVQKVPVKCVSLFNEALNFLKSICKSSIVLCTATQPALDFVDYKLDVPRNNDMISDINKVNLSFERTKIIDRSRQGPVTNEELQQFISTKLEDENSILVILNTKSAVRNLYVLLNECDSGVPLYHLSTSMCASHRKRLLAEIRKYLANNEQVICVTTQLIEAGVDVDFDCVIRSLAGLDSIAQAAGRCNRHGKKDIKKVYLIDHRDEKLSRLREIQKGKEISKKLLKEMKTEGGNEILSPPAMTRYFQEFYTDLESELDYYVPRVEKNMTDLLFWDRTQSDWVKSLYSKYNHPPKTYLVTSYGTAAEHFSVIDNLTTSVLVPYEEGKEHIADLNGYETIEHFSQFMKQAQHFSINIYSQQKQDLEKQGALVSFLDGAVLALKEGFYSDEFGLDIREDGAGFDNYVF